MSDALTPLGPADPRQLGTYRLLGTLGAGGMGTVYLGRSGRRLAAVKTLRPELARDAHLLARFQNEIRAASAVRHHGVAAVLDSDMAAVPPWFAGEFVAGPTLAECVANHGPLAEHAVRGLASARSDCPCVTFARAFSSWASAIWRSA